MQIGNPVGEMVSSLSFSYVIIMMMVLMARVELLQMEDISVRGDHGSHELDD